MKLLLKFLTLLIFIAFNFSLTNAQSISGKVVDNEGVPLDGLRIILAQTYWETVTNGAGNFKLNNVEEGDYSLVIYEGGEIITKKPISHTGNDLKLGTVTISRSDDNTSESIGFAVISLSEIELENEEDQQDVSGILSSGRDIFVNTAAFGFGSARFQPRGLEGDYQSMYINGIPMNELENGRTYFAQWGGLNDVFRNAHINYGLTQSQYGIGGMIGNNNIDIRAGRQRQQTRVSYARANRSYNNRLMFTHSTGFNKSGWAYSISGSRRWAQEGHVTGTFYDAWGYFLGVEKRINERNNLYFNLMGAPNRRGKSGAALQEIIDIVGDRFYNPYWGYQEGKKRNSRVGHAHQPIFMLGHDWNSESGKTQIESAVSYQFGRNGGTALNWGQASNPAADYHRKLPSRIEDPVLRQEVIDLIQENPDFYQVDWDFLYEANRNNLQTVENVNGVEGNDQNVNLARYIIEDRRYDSKELNGNIKITQTISDRNQLIGGLRYRTYNGHNFAEVEDLLGAEAFLDIDRFADGVGAPGTEQRDLDNPNRLVQEGDIFSYDYDSKITNSSIWLQDEISLKRFDAFIGGEFNRSTLQRIGNMRNGYYPDNSLGESEQHVFNNYSLKGGLTYKYSGRLYFWTSGYLGTKAPYFRDAFINPRSNNFTVPLLENSKEKSAEIGFQYKSPSLTLKALGYYADIDDETEVVFFFSDQDFVLDGQAQTGAFGSFINHNIDKRHVGLELAAEYKINTEFSIKTVAALGQHLYDSRWRQWAKSDELPGFFRDDVTIYSNNFYVESSPQTAANFELRYSSPHYWFATLSVNYFNNRYLDFSTDRRTELATQEFVGGSEDLADLVQQEKLNDFYTLDLFAYKSFKIKKYFIYLSASVNNILDNQSMITGGYEQLRFNPDEGKDYFASRYYYGYGRNFFLGLTFRL